MPVKQAPFYWIECDHPGCDARCPHEMDEVAAWSDDDTARMMAEESDWRRVERPSARPLWMCPDHRNEYCESCGAHLGPLAGDQDYRCEPGCPQPAYARTALLKAHGVDEALDTPDPEGPGRTVDEWRQHLNVPPTQ